MKQTTLDLNGPILGFSTHPQNVTVNNAGIATFIGIATAYFTSQNPTNIFSSNTGVVTHRWYAAGIGALSDGTNTTLGATLSGTATTTLTVSSATSDIQLFVSADYIPSAYQSSSPITAGTGRSTGNAINEILFSNNATLTVNSFITINTQPSSSGVAQGQTATFSVTAASSSNTAVAYQWYIDDSPVSNGTSGGNTISGANTNILTVTTSSSTPVGISNIFVSVSHPTAGNSPVVSNVVGLVVILPRAILNFELLTTSSSTAILSNVNLETTSAFTYNATIFGNSTICFYAPEKDINLELEIFASKGLDSGAYYGGQGGYSKIRFTVRKNEEYVITPLQLRAGGVIAPAFNVTGGSIQTIGIYTYHYFYGGTGTYTITGNPSGYSFDWLLVAGGGAGGNGQGGSSGGGAGGMKTGTVTSASAGTRSFIIGNGGVAGLRWPLSPYTPSTPGSLSSAVLPDGTSVSVSGGGVGYGLGEGASNLNGGSGGGGKGFGFEPALGIPGEGNNGGRTPSFAGAGGGGKGSVGGDGEQGTRGGNGGRGESWVDGRFYADGGGGGIAVLGKSGGYGGTGGGGKGGDGNISGISGSENASSATGGGGGGGGGGYMFSDENPGQSGNGANGIFAIRYLTPLSQSNYRGSFFIYRKAALIAVVGAGGDSGNAGNGGNGGGINVSSASGSGRGAGGFNFAIPAGSLPSTGVFGSGATQEPYAGTGDTKASDSNGGRVLPCARGRYWRDLGYSACQDLGNIQFFTDSGVKLTNTATISRGYKIGYDIRQTSGAGSNGGGAGGQGAQGGQGGVNGGGGGGGNGYTDGSVTVVSTQQGGSTGDAKIIFRTF